MKGRQGGQGGQNGQGGRGQVNGLMDGLDKEGRAVRVDGRAGQSRGGRGQVNGLMVVR